MYYCIMKLLPYFVYRNTLSRVDHDDGVWWIRLIWTALVEVDQKILCEIIHDMC